MNNLKELIQKYSDGKDTKSMEAVTDIIGDFLKNNVSEEAYCGLYKDIYSELVGGHFNKDFADVQIAKMYYTDSKGDKHYAPYWTEGEAKEIYEKVKDKLPSEYNFYDFEAVLNMIKSDYCPLLEKWYKEEHPMPTPTETPKPSTDAPSATPATGAAEPAKTDAGASDAEKPSTDAAQDAIKQIEYLDACKKWCAGKFVDLAVNWLADDDNPFGNEKAWLYFNS